MSTIAKLSKGKTRKVESARGSPKLSAEVYQITQFPVCCKLRTKKLQKIRQKPEAVVIRKMLLLLRPRVYILGLLLSIFIYLTHNTPLIQLWCAQSKLNMEEICSLNIHLWYVDIPQKVLLKSLHAQRRSFYYWICNLMHKSPLWSKMYCPKKALRMEEFQNNFF